MMTAESVEQLLIECACHETDITYSEALRAFGLRFTRPKMRELCRLLGVVDDDARLRGDTSIENSKRSSSFIAEQSVILDSQFCKAFAACSAS